MRIMSARRLRHITYGQDRRSDAKETQRRIHVKAGCVKAGCGSKLVPEELISERLSLIFQHSQVRSEQI